MSLREVTRRLRKMRMCELALSRTCDPAFAKEYLGNAEALLHAIRIVEQQGNKHRRKVGENDKT